MTENQNKIEIAESMITNVFKKLIDKNKYTRFNLSSVRPKKKMLQPLNQY